MQVLMCDMENFKTKSAGYLVNHLGRLMANGLQRRIEPLGLAPAQFMTLLELWEGDGITQRALVERLEVEQATMANTLTRMERDGLITRRAHPDDKRARLVFLTEKARGLQEAAVAAARAQNAEALGGLTQDEQEVLVVLMKRMIGRLKRTN